MLDAGFRFSTSGGVVAEGKTILSAIYSSPLIRALHTARIFADVLKNGASGEGEVELLDDLIERDFGVMAGLPTSSIPAICGDDKILKTDTINYFLDPEGAETFPQLVDRAKRLLDHIETLTKDLPTDSSILLVTHGDFGKMLLAAYYDIPWEDVLRQFHFGNSEVLLLSKESSPDKAHVFETQQFNA